jgi:hypothetical protein
MDQAEGRVQCQALLLSMQKLELLPVIGVLVHWLVGSFVRWSISYSDVGKV